MALIFDLVRRRKAVMKLAQRASQIYEQSVGLQRSAQERALLAKGAANTLRSGSLGSSSPEDIALLVALDTAIQTRSILNVSTNELEMLIVKTRPHVGFLGSPFRFARNLLSIRDWNLFHAQYFKYSSLCMKPLKSCLLTLFLFSTLTSCAQGDESSFCNAAIEFNAKVEKIDISDIASASGPEFWDSLSKSVDKLQEDSPELFQTQLQNLEAELDGFIAKLEENDFNLLLTVLDPATVQSLITFVESVLYAVNTEIVAFTDENCQ